MFHIVLFEPEIPANAGNIARTCAVTGAVLHLIEPLGFSVDDKHLKRAGLDYWHLLDIRYHKSLADFFEQNPDGRYFYFTSKGQSSHAGAVFQPGDYLIFGKETAGLPEELLRAHPERCVRIPMRPGVRCLNLSNAVAVGLYEALRQTDFEDLTAVGPFPAVLD